MKLPQIKVNVEKGTDAGNLDVLRVIVVTTGDYNTTGIITLDLRSSRKYHCVSTPPHHTVYWVRTLWSSSLSYFLFWIGEALQFDAIW